MEISTSLLSVKKEDIIQTIYNLEVAHTDYFHIDVMDGRFVENDTSETMRIYCEYLNQVTNVPIDVHLMVTNVKEYIDSYSIFNPNIITFHYEAVKDKEKICDIIKQIRDNNCQVGMAIKPETSIKDIYEFLPYLNLVLVMTVEPGKGGQTIITETIRKIKILKEYIREKNLDTYIEADGGINIKTIEELKEAGIDIAVVGTGIVKTDNYAETVKKLKI